MITEFTFLDALEGKNIAEIITSTKDVVLYKTEFKIAGTQESRHSSGNRCIIAAHKDAAQIRVLLVYSKTDLSGHNETAEWKKLVKENYPEYQGLL